MKYLLDKWDTEKCFFKVMRKTFLVCYVSLNLAFIILPFFGATNARNVLEIIWYISCVFMLDSTVDDFIYSKKQGKPTEAYLSIPIIITLIVVFISYYYIRLPWLIIIAIYFISALVQEIIMISVKGKFIQWPLNKMAALPTTARLNAVGGMFYALALVIFFVSIYYKMLGIELIIGAIVLIFIIISISQTIPNWGEKHKAGAIAKFFVLLNFVSAFAVIIYLIYLIENSQLQSIVLTISAAAIGGLLTLSGVAWTIRRQDGIRKEEETKKFKPYFIITNNEYNIKIDNIRIQEDIPDGANKLYGIRLEPFNLRLSENADSLILGIKINEHILPCEYSFLVLRNNVFQLDLTKNSCHLSKDKILKLFILCKDLLNNHYEIPCYFKEKYDGLYPNDTVKIYDYIYSIHSIGLPRPFKEQL
jgi:hypothetical protein